MVLEKLAFNASHTCSARDYMLAGTSLGVMLSYDNQSVRNTNNVYKNNKLIARMCRTVRVIKIFTDKSSFWGKLFNKYSSGRARRHTEALVVKVLCSEFHFLFTKCNSDHTTRFPPFVYRAWSGWSIIITVGVIYA